MTSAQARRVYRKETGFDAVLAWPAPYGFRLFGLLQDQRAEDLVGDADAAGLGEVLRILLGQHRAPHAGSGRVAERAFTLQAAGHLRKHRIEKHRLEVGRRRLGLGLRGGRDLGECIREFEIGAGVDRRG
jgi:hypothetical protein